MIRALFLLLALGLGLALAAASQTRMYHLRWLIPDRLPGWTDRIAGDAGLLNGRLTLGKAGGAALAWRALALDASGLRWRIAATGGGLDLTGTAGVPFDLSRADLTEIGGTVSLGDLPGGGGGAAGQIVLADGTGHAEPFPRPTQISGALDGNLQGVSFDEVPLGGGPLTVTMAPLGSWRASFSLTGGALEAAGEITGRLGRDRASLNLELTEKGEIPDRWRNALALAATRGETGWTLRQSLPVPVLPMPGG